MICYQYQLNALAAVGVSYGAMKSIAFAALGLILSITNMLRGRLFHEDVENRSSSVGNVQDDSTDYPSPKVISMQRYNNCCSRASTAIFLIGVIATVPAILHHEVSGAKKSTLDYLRGERFLSYSVTVLLPLTIIFTLGLFPWWAFYPLDDPKWKSGQLTDKEIANRIHKFVHNVVLHHKFSTGFGTLLTAVRGVVAQQTR